MMSDIGRRIMKFILGGNVTMIKNLIEIGFLSAPYDSYNFTGGDSNNPEDHCSALELIARQHYVIHNYKEMIDLLLLHGADKENNALETAYMFKNYRVAAYLKYKGMRCNEIYIKTYGESIGIDLLNEVSLEYKKLLD